MTCRPAPAHRHEAGGEAAPEPQHHPAERASAGVPLFLQRRALQLDAQPGPLEREAAAIAEQVMRMPDDAAAAPQAQRVQPGASGSMAAPPIVHAALSSPGQPLDGQTRAHFESRFSEDFGQVRVHTDALAAESAREVSAHGYTAGQEIVFAEGQFAPATTEGKRLIAHELAHVLQQSGGKDARSEGMEGQTRAAGDGRAGRALIQRDIAPFEPKLSPAQVLAKYEQAMDHNFFEGLARRLYDESTPQPSYYAYLREVFAKIDPEYEDNVAAELIKNWPDPTLDRFAASAEGRAMLDVLYQAIITGDVTKFQRKQSERIIEAKKRRMPVEQYLAQSERKRIFPVRNIGITRVASATFRAKLLPNGRVHVRYTSVRLYQYDMFKEDRETLPPYSTTMNGFELDPDQVVGVRLHDEGGTLVEVPALALIDFSNQIQDKTISTAATAFFLGLTFGAGALGSAGVRAISARVAAGEASKVTLYGARALLGADRVAWAIPAGSMVINDHRDWIVKTFPSTGPALLDALDQANRIAGYYGWGRLGFEGVRLVAAKLRPAWQAWRAEAEHAKRAGIAPSDQKLVKGIDDEAESLLNELDLAERQAKPAAPPTVAPEKPTAPPPAGEPAGAAVVRQEEVAMGKQPAGKRGGERARPIVAKAKGKDGKGGKKASGKAGKEAEPAAESEVAGAVEGKGPQRGGKKQSTAEPEEKGAPAPETPSSAGAAPPATRLSTDIGGEDAVVSALQADGTATVTYGARSTTIAIADKANHPKLVRELGVSGTQATQILRDIHQAAPPVRKLLIGFAQAKGDPRAYCISRLRDPTKEHRWSSDAFDAVPEEGIRRQARDPGEAAPESLRLSPYAYVFEEEVPSQFIPKRSATTNVQEYQYPQYPGGPRGGAAVTRPRAVVRVNDAGEIVEIVDHVIPGPAAEARAKLIELLQKLGKVNLSSQ